MPTIPKEQIIEIELEMADLVEENKELRELTVAQAAEILRLRERLKRD